MKKETRNINAEFRVVRSEGAQPMISGYAAIFNSDSEDLGGFTERIAPGAFKDALKISDARALFNHDSNFVLGRQSAKTLRLEEDETGLRMEIDPPDTQFARDLMVSIERGDINQQSFGFSISSDGDSWADVDGRQLRTINKVSRLFDVSPVTYPAYPDTTVAVRSLEAHKDAERSESENSKRAVERRGQLLNKKSNK